MKGHQTFFIRKHSDNTTRVEHKLGGYYWTQKKFDAPENTEVTLFVKEYHPENQTLHAEWSMLYLYKENQVRNFNVLSIGEDSVSIMGKSGDKHFLPNGPNLNYPFAESDMGKVLSLKIKRILRDENDLEFDLDAYLDQKNTIVPYLINTDLRPYQIQSKMEIYRFWQDGHRNILLQMPTGTGKTRLFCSIVREFFIASTKDDIKRVLLVVHREELVLQIRDTLSKNYQLGAGIIKNGYQEEPRIPIQIASIQTLKNRTLPRKPTLVIIDEAHHATAETYLDLWKRFPEAYFLGVTATPYRLTGEGFTSLFDKLVTSPSINAFIADGYLSPLKYYAVKEKRKFLSLVGMRGGDYRENELSEFLDTEKSRNVLVRTYQELAFGKKGIVYCVTKHHSQFVKEAYCAAGIPAEHIDADTQPELRKEIIAKFKKGAIKVLCNVDIFSEGFDCPDIEFVQLARPTRSLSKYLQQIGRSTRPHQSKSFGIILDNVGNHLENGIFNTDWDWLYFFQGFNTEELDKEGIVRPGSTSRLGPYAEEEDDNLYLILDPEVRDTETDSEGIEFMEINRFHFFDGDLQTRFHKILAIGYSEEEAFRVIELLHNEAFQIASKKFNDFGKLKVELEKLKAQRVEFEQQIMLAKVDLSEADAPKYDLGLMSDFPDLKLIFDKLSETGILSEEEMLNILKEKRAKEYQAFLERCREKSSLIEGLKESLTELNEKLEIIDEQVVKLNQRIFEIVSPIRNGNEK